MYDKRIPFHRWAFVFCVDATPYHPPSPRALPRKEIADLLCRVRNGDFRAPMTDLPCHSASVCKRSSLRCLTNSLIRVGIRRLARRNGSQTSLCFGKWMGWIQNAPSARPVGDGDEKFLLGKEIFFNAVPCKVRAMSSTNLAEPGKLSTINYEATQDGRELSGQRGGHHLHCCPFVQRTFTGSLFP
jgi:hypothetical protein